MVFSTNLFLWFRDPYFILQCAGGLHGAQQGIFNVELEQPPGGTFCSIPRPEP